MKSLSRFEEKLNANVKLNQMQTTAIKGGGGSDKRPGGGVGQPPIKNGGGMI